MGNLGDQRNHEQQRERLKAVCKSRYFLGFGRQRGCQQKPLCRKGFPSLTTKATDFYKKKEIIVII